MKGPFNYQIQRLMLPGLKRWIFIVLAGIIVIVVGALLLLGYHPLTVTGSFIRDILEHAAEVLPYRISGLIVILAGAFVICLAIARIISYVVASYLPAEDRESIPDVLYRRHQLESAPRVVVIGGGTGLSTLLKGLKYYTNNITAIVTVGDDGGSSGRLRQELGVLPPGDIRNCITALADEEKLVTELFQYRFDSGAGLEGHSFGNLFLTALCAITHGDMLEAVRVASRVLNSCGQVLPATLSNITLVAEMEDGTTVSGESRITKLNGRIKRLRCEPEKPKPTPDAIQAILNADLVILGPGSLYTSVIPNLLITGVADSLRETNARKIYICNVMTQAGETTAYSVADHIEALLMHANCPMTQGSKLIDGVVVNNQEAKPNQSATPVVYDPERIKEFGIKPVLRPLLSKETTGHHDAHLLAQEVMLWYFRHKRHKAKLAKAHAARLERSATVVQSRAKINTEEKTAIDRP